MHVRPSVLHTHIAELGEADLGSLISFIAALQLVPENSGHLARLECSVELLGAHGWRSGGRVLPASEAIRWLQGSPFGFGDDPLNDRFTDEVVFFGGSYRVLPGASEAAEFIFRHLGRATFLGEPWPAGRELQQAVARMAGAILRVSNAIAERAGLGRDVAGEGRGALLLPEPGQLKRLIEAVSFSVDELDDLLSDVGGAAALEPLRNSPGQ